MNQKTAKKLRKIALGMAVAAEQQSGKPIDRVKYEANRAGTLSVSKNTWKGAYKSLKKGVSTGKISNQQLVGA